MARRYWAPDMTQNSVPDSARQWCSVCEREHPYGSDNAYSPQYYQELPTDVNWKGKVRRYTSEQRAHAREVSARWRAAHPSYAKSYRAANPERMQRAQQRWAAAHPEFQAEAVRQRRARVAAAAGCYSAEQKAWRFAMWGGRCWMCGVPATATDHVKPLSKGGSNWPANLRPSCKRCNSRKHAHWPIVIASWVRPSAPLYSQNINAEYLRAHSISARAS